MNTHPFKSILRLLWVLLNWILGAFIALVCLFVWSLEQRPDLKVWHTVELDAEFTAQSKVNNFQEYLALEETLFTQLDELVYDRTEPKDRLNINRYSEGSMADPRRWSPNWNRTFELKHDTPRAGVLLLHGLSDSPYSMHSLGTRLHAAGAWVVGLRIPGHGTAPSGLVKTSWQDMAAAVRLAMHHLQDKITDRPLYIVGYSNGGALAVRYAFEALEDTTLPAVNRLVLLSPEIGVAQVAALAVWQARIGHILALRKLEWNDILPEFDPFKYGSFAINAGDLSYRLTAENKSSLANTKIKEKLKKISTCFGFSICSR